MKNKKENNLNKKMALIGTMVSILLVSAVGFAYFSATVVNTNNEKLSTETGALSLKTNDNDNGISETLNLGEVPFIHFSIESRCTNTVCKNSLVFCQLVC